MQFEISNHIAIQVKNLRQATEFYSDVMGMKILSDDGHEAEIKCGNTIFHVENSEGGKTFFDFKVKDLKEAKSRLEAAGCNLDETSCDQGRSYLVSDPFGMKFHLFQDRA